jgi:hypothetical protein
MVVICIRENVQVLSVNLREWCLHLLALLENALAGSSQRSIAQSTQWLRSPQLGKYPPVLQDLDNCEELAIPIPSTMHNTMATYVDHLGITVQEHFLVSSAPIKVPSLQMPIYTPMMRISHSDVHHISPSLQVPYPAT